jgi:hypothetical protein
MKRAGGFSLVTNPERAAVPFSDMKTSAVGPDRNNELPGSREFQGAVVETISAVRGGGKCSQADKIYGRYANSWV